jgi:DNA-binding transcriptional LysR family regulator
MAIRKFPSMTALRGFEACARHLNFSQAALELHITQSAISHQIKQLEESMGAQFFDRSSGAMTLTKAGAELLPTVRTFLKDINALAGRFERDAQGQSMVELFVHDSFANTWLIPRLPRFYAAHPNIQIRQSQRTGRHPPGRRERRLAGFVLGVHPSGADLSGVQPCPHRPPGAARQRGGGPQVPDHPALAKPAKWGNGLHPLMGLLAAEERPVVVAVRMRSHGSSLQHGCFSGHPRPGRGHGPDVAPLR